MSEEEAHAAFVRLRFAENNGEPKCVWCGHADVYTINRRARSTTTGEVRTRTVFRCKSCQRQFSVTSGTIFASHKLSFVAILHAIARFTNGAKGVSAIQMRHDIHVEYKTAFVLLHKLREAIGQGQKEYRLRGEIEIDATYVGNYARPRNRIKDREDRRRMSSKTGKQSLVIIRERGSKGRSVPLVATESEAVPVIRRIVEKGAVIFADESPSWNALHAHFTVHRVDHSKEYSAGKGVSTNQAESYWARFKRSRKGVYHRINGVHVLAYHAELAWREDNRHQPRGEQFEAITAAGLAHPVSRVWKGYWQRRKAA